MKKILLLSAIAALIVSSCSVVPISGRKQLNLVSDSDVLQSSLASYREYISKATLSTQTVKCEQVTRVGRKIATATEAYLKANGMSDQVSNFAWEFNLVRDSQLNAFCIIKCFCCCFICFNQRKICIIFSCFRCIIDCKCIA